MKRISLYTICMKMIFFCKIVIACRCLIYMTKCLPDRSFFINLQFFDKTVDIDISDSRRKCKAFLLDQNISNRSISGLKF